MSETDSRLYSSKIIRAGALLPDTKTLLTHWDQEVSVQDNLRRATEENWFGKASRSWIDQVLAIFRQRYLSDRDVLAALVALEGSGTSPETMDRILFFLAAQSDALLHDVVTEVLAPLARLGQVEVSTWLVADWVAKQVAAGKTESEWSESTVRRVAQGLLATLRDFGVLQGAVRKRLSSICLTIEAFAFLAFLLQREQASGDRLLHHPDWRLFFLSSDAVERLFLEAHQERLLSYHAAGRVIRVEFPAQTAEEYAHAIAQRPA